MARASFTSDFWTRVLLLAFVVILLVFVPSYVFLFLGAFILANSVHYWTQGSQLGKGIFWVVLLGVFILLGALFGSQLNIDFSAFVHQIQQGFTSLQGKLSEYDLFSAQDLERFINSGIGQQLLQPLGSALRLLALLLFLFFLAIFMSFEMDSLQGLFERFVKHFTRRPQKVQKRFSGVPVLLHSWVLNRLFSMTVVAVLTYGGLLFVDIEYRFWLSLLAGLLSFIPNLGPLLSFVPAALLGISSGPYTVLVLMGIYSVVQLLESQLITPLALKQTMNIPASLTFAFQIVFGSLFGFLGLLFAVPIGIALMQVLELFPDKD